MILDTRKGRKGNYKHCMQGTKMYQKWMSMRRRCNNPNTKDYKNYGGRGIKVCNEWNHFINFMNWSLSNKYDDNLELDRIDNNSGYSPNNCRYVTHKENGSNKRNNVLITANGITKTVSEWAIYLGISRKTIQSRLHYGWKGEKLLLPSKLGNNQFTNYGGAVNE